ncbi:MAG: DUF2157 domain-containing protein [Pseudomonadota bacterium]
MRLIRLFKRDLRGEIDEWVREDLITQEQAQKICARYGIEFEGDSSSFGYRLLLALGYLFVGLALIVLIGGNWEDIPRELRMGGLMLLTVGTQVFGLRKFRSGDEKIACIVFFLGNLFFGASIILIAQIYHLGEHMPDGVYWWALGTLPFALITRNAWLMIQTLVLAGIWYVLELSFGYSTWSAPLFLAAAIYVLLGNSRSVILFLLTMVGSAFVFEATLWQLIGVEHERYLIAISVPVSAAIAMLYWAFSQWLNSRESNTAKDYGALLELWSLRFGVLFLFLASFEFFWDELYYWHRSHALITISFVTLLTTAAILGIRASRPRTTLVSIASIVVIFLIPALVAHPHTDVAMQILINVVAIIAGVRLIIRGLSIGKSQHYFLGIVLILGIGLMRYFDLIGSYVGGALVFGFFAIVMLASARYWKRRMASA